MTTSVSECLTDVSDADKADVVEYRDDAEWPKWSMERSMFSIDEDRVLSKQRNRRNDVNAAGTTASLMCVNSAKYSASDVCSKWWFAFVMCVPSFILYNVQSKSRVLYTFTVFGDASPVRVNSAYTSHNTYTTYSI